MDHIVDPTGDLIRDSVSIIVDKNDTHETALKIDEDWTQVINEPDPESAKK